MSNNPIEKFKQEKPNSIATVSKYFEQFKGQLEAALPSHLTADRMTRLALTAMSQNKDLGLCTPKSLFGSVVIASQLGLEIGVLGQGFLVPYNVKGTMTCTFIPGWKGLVDLVSRAGRATVWTGAVFEGDKFEFALGDSPFVKHVPMGEDDPNLLTHVYAIGRVNGAQLPVIEVWPIARVWKHRNKYNRQGDKHYSYKYPEQYARKIPLLRVIDYIPKSVELAKALQTEHAYADNKQIIIEGDFLTVDDSEEAVEQKAAEPAKGKKDKPPSEEKSFVLTPADIKASLQNAKSVDEVNIAADLIREVQDPAAQAELEAIYAARLKEFNP